MSRKFKKKIKRVVIKIGSGIIANFYMKPQSSGLRFIVKEIAALRKKGIDVVLVSSGSIVLGLGEICAHVRPSDVSSLQALAAIGQNVLMRTYTDLFKKNKLRCAQILLTWDDFDVRLRYNNARSTINKILDYGLVPIINENDTISTDEIKFGDNDKLSALVASLIESDLLLILSDVDGLYDLRDKEKKIFREIKEVTKEIEALALGTAKKNVSKGGMLTKIEAVKIATQAKIPCVIANGNTKNVVRDVLSGKCIGTFFVEKEEKLLAKRHWISFGVKPKGKIIVDQGAKEALLKGGKSLLLPGVVGWEGYFKKEDVVAIVDQANSEIARGIINYSVNDLHKINNKKGEMEVVHCNEMVLCQR
ncbi:MAG: glutamate 5-kinase [Candidatus Omnitrophica bacterium]|nr:glutamate 5-kinase [Candidatus Omnitrophota bacterium]